MTDDTWPVLLGRIDFGWITSLHILYPPLTIGLAVMLFIGELLWIRTDDEYWYRLTRFFERLLIVNFAAGVATGITMELAFGILYGPFSQAAGPFFGQVLGYETITAFMYEAGFIGLMIFGWGKISRGMHLFATFNVAAASAISAMWILDANSWMQTPDGVVFRDGVFAVTDWWKALFNRDVIFGFPHMLVASFEEALAVAAAVSAWSLLRGRHVAMFRRSLAASLIALAVVAPLQVLLGDSLGVTVARDQPTVLAAMEGHYHTRNPDGSVRTGWNLLAWPDARNDGNAWAITIPHVLSLLETHTWNGAVQGLDDVPPRDRPPVLIPFYGFRVMVACGFAMVGLSLVGCVMLARGRFDRMTRGTVWFLRATVAAAALPFLSAWVGWWTREVGRQPWVVFGLMRTSDGVSQMSVLSEVCWLVGYMGFELTVWAATWWFLAKIVRQGPNMTSPVVRGGSQHLGELPSAAHAEPLERETPKAEEPSRPGHLRPA